MRCFNYLFILFSMLLLMIIYYGCRKENTQEQENGESISEDDDYDAVDSIPYYFIAIHNEPNNVPEGILGIEKSFETLRQMVENADSFNIKLTLMFTAQWVDYIFGEEERISEVTAWKDNGHELSSHHHSVYHGNWDGYTDFSKTEVQLLRNEHVGYVEPYFGTLKDFENKLKLLNPDIKSGCVNDEADKRVMPDSIIYDACSGFANYGEPGQRLNDGIAEKGINRFVSTGVYKGIERKWLTHAQICRDNQEADAEEVFKEMESGVYGVVTHSFASQSEHFYKYLNFIHSLDPYGEKSKTLSSIIDEKLLEEKKLPQPLIDRVYYNKKVTIKQPFKAFIAVHMEVDGSTPAPERDVTTLDYQQDRWPALKRLVALADKFKIKLTLEFNPQWAAFILDYEFDQTTSMFVKKENSQMDRLDTIRIWELGGHEIALHHHGPSHGDWNGFTDDPLYFEHESYIGSVSDVMELMNQLPVEGKILTGGITNENTDWPDGVIFDTDGGAFPEDLLSTPSDIIYNGYSIKQLRYRIYAKHEANLEEVESAYDIAGSDEYMGIVFHALDFENDPVYVVELFKSLTENGVRVNNVSSLLMVQ